MCWFLSLVHRANGNDGPKWTCGIQLLKQPCIIFSLGCNNLIDFESEMYEWGQCTVHVFDPTVDGSIAPSLKQQAGATLHLLGLGTPGQVRYHSPRLLLSCIAVATVLVLMLCLPRPFLVQTLTRASSSLRRCDHTLQRLGNGELKDLKGLMAAASVTGYIDVLKVGERTPSLFPSPQLAWVVSAPVPDYVTTFRSLLAVLRFGGVAAIPWGTLPPITALLLFKLPTLCRSLALLVVHRVSGVQIDVEGYEWAPLLQVFKDLSEGKMSVGQMQVELHSMLDVSISPSPPLTAHHIIALLL
jgi:hypothetical protein